MSVACRKDHEGMMDPWLNPTKYAEGNKVHHHKIGKDHFQLFARV